MGSALVGITANLFCWGRGTVGLLPLTYFYLPKSDGAYLFIQSDEINYFCSGPVSVDRICPQPRQLDIELEVGCFVGPGNALGELIPLERAEELGGWWIMGGTEEISKKKLLKSERAEELGGWWIMGGTEEISKKKLLKSNSLLISFDSK